MHGVAGVHKTTALSFAPVLGGLDSPTYVTSAPGDPDTLYVVEQPGTIRIVRDGKIAGTFLDIHSLVVSGGEQGLLSMAFSPHYTSNHLFYVSYTNVHGDSRVVRYRSANGVGIRSSARILLAVNQPYSNHNGGQLQFDKRGYLYFGLGDGGSGGDPQQHAQNMHSRLGKLLRSRSKSPGTRWKTVGLGLRNPWRFSFDSANDNLWLGDVGEGRYEEIDFRRASKLDKLANYGWSRYEGYSVYDSSHRYANTRAKVRPVLVYSHDHGCSVTGGFVYRGQAVRAARGRYFYGDYCAGTVWSFRVGKHGRASAAVVSGHVPSLSSFGVDGNRELYATSLEGTLYRLRGSGSAERVRGVQKTVASSAHDWTRFGWDARRSNDDPHATGITAANANSLTRQQVHLPGTVDSSPIYLHGVSVSGATHDAFFVTTTYGITLAIDAANGQILWRWTPPHYSQWAGSEQITTATPVADPSRRWIYAASPDGRIQKLSVANGHAAWRRSITKLPSREKIAASLNFAAGHVIATTGGYIGDTPPYQGHVVVIAARNGRLLHVWNSLCSNQHRLLVPAGCPQSDSAIWGRAGAVVVPRSGKLLVATGNGPWFGHIYWGDSVLVLSSKARLVGNYTPKNTGQLNAGDLDLGSTSPVYLTSKLIAQGGKDGKIRLLSLRRLRGTRPHKGHELQIVSTPSGTDLFTAPAVWRSGKHVWLIAADGGGTQAWSLQNGRLHSVWRNGHGGTSPVIAGGLLWVYDPGGGLRVYQPESGQLVKTLSAGGGHWNSPIVTDGRVALPEGDANDHATSGVLDIWR